MSFDNSRFTFDPWQDYFGVVMQQGRVQLDSDWNEWIAEFARRVQAGTLDLVGLSGVPSTTPFAFNINASNASNGSQVFPKITFGAGRMYVDGLLAENHGSATNPQPTWDPALAEWSAAPQGAGILEVDVDYTNQNYLPGTTLTADQVANKQFLVYLDVWQRDITYLQDPDLVETAVGVDTTGRRQTVWQVKLLDVTGLGMVPASPDASIPPWATLIQLSAAQLSVATGGTPTTTAGPCALSEASGYTGLENQLYRIEIHQSGNALSVPPPVGTALLSGTATFKWSRENASVATPVTGIAAAVGNNASQLTVQGLGRDQVLGFRTGDWIEITDDFLELSGQGGELHRIQNIVIPSNIIVLESTVNAANFPVIGGSTDPSRHTRIVRWDQSGTVFQSDGVSAWFDLDSKLANATSTPPLGISGIPIPPPGVALNLENGIIIGFDGLASTGNTFRSGDYWTFPARTADSSVDTLNQVPPQGVNHHYARLATVDFSSTPPTVVDCRRAFQTLANPCVQVSSVFVDPKTTLVNDGLVSIQALLNDGITVTCDSPLDPTIITQPGLVAPGTQLNSPLCYVTLELPSPTFGGSFTSVVLPSAVSVTPSPTNSLVWKSAFADPADQTTLESLISPSGPPVLARLTLIGNAIRSAVDPTIFLNGRGDGRRSANFEMWFWLMSQPALSLSATSLDFGTQAATQQSNSQVVTLTNTSAADVPINIASSSESFTQTNNCGASVAAGASCQITVTFTPPAAGSFTGKIILSDNTDSTDLDLALQGTGIQPAVAFTPSSLAFPVQIVGTTSAPQAVTLTAGGTSQLVVSDVSIVATFQGAVATNFTQTNTVAGGTLQAGGSSAIQVSCTPGAVGAQSAFLQITHNAPGSPISVPLSGTATPGIPVISASALGLNFGRIVVNNTSSLTLTLKNVGSALLSVTGVSIVGSGEGAYNFGNTCSTLQPNQTCTISVSFHSSVISTFPATLVISHNAAGSPLNIPMTGTTVAKSVVFDKIHDKITVKSEQEGILQINRFPPVLQRSQEVKEIPTQKAFITPEERPVLGQEALAKPADEPVATQPLAVQPDAEQPPATEQSPVEGQSSADSPASETDNNDPNPQ